MSFLEGLFNNTLSAWQWGLLAAVPPLIVMLYFLKLRRRPIEVPSTYLWSRALEDLHVNSIWQRLRQNLLLLLQLLLIVLVMLALIRPGWRGTTLSGDRFIFLIDTSASMSATDVAPTRLAEAKKQALQLIDQMKGGDVAMVISFSDVARVEQSFTNNRRVLASRVEQIAPTQRASDLTEALRVAAGLANPGRSSDASNPGDLQVAEALPATVYLLTDGGFPQVVGFSLGNLEPKYMPIGREAKNVGIVAFTSQRNPERPEQVQAFARVVNYGPADASVEASLYRGQELLDAQQVRVPSQGQQGVQFDLREVEPGELRLEISPEDDLKVDNVAYAAINAQRPIDVVCVTPGNDALKLALETPAAQAIAHVTFAPPSILMESEHQRLAEEGEYDLIIYDRCVPPKLPAANTFFLGATPSEGGWSAGDKIAPAQIIDVDREHPLTSMPDPSHVRIAEAFAVNGPTGSLTLMDSQGGPILVSGPRFGFEDAVLGFGLLDAKDQPNTDWPRWYSFPIFFQNVLRYLGGGGREEAAPSVKPGVTVGLRSVSPVNRLRIRNPAGDSDEVSREASTLFRYAGTERLGSYEVREGNQTEIAQRFAVNLFDTRESDLTPATAVNIGHNEVGASASALTVRKELWKWLLGCGLCVLLFEWYVYNRRVYL